VLVKNPQNGSNSIALSKWGFARVWTIKQTTKPYGQRDVFSLSLKKKKQTKYQKNLTFPRLNTRSEGIMITIRINPLGIFFFWGGEVDAKADEL
jgi:hypothetical protein